MTDKVSIIESAREYAKKGKIDKAIAEWSKILTFSRDGHVCNNIGDLYIKKEAQDEAIEFFTQAAKIFKKNGFDTKAIAIYNKILTIEPDRLDIVNALTKLHLERGLPGKALEDILKISENLSNDGDTKDALKVLESALSIAPSDPQVQEKVEALSLKLSMEEEAAAKEHKSKFNWGRGRTASTKTPKKVKIRKKTVWTYIARAAVFAVAALAALTFTFGDGERLSDDVMIEVSLISASRTDNKPINSSIKEEHLTDETIVELTEPEKETQPLDESDETLKEETEVLETAVTVPDETLTEPLPDADIPEMNTEREEEETATLTPATHAEKGTLIIPAQEDKPADSSSEAVEAEAAAAPEVQMQDIDLSQPLDEVNTPEIKNEAVDEEAITPEAGVKDADRETEFTDAAYDGQAGTPPVTEEALTAENKTEHPDAEVAAEHPPAPVFQEKRLVTYEDQFNDNAHNWEIFATEMASASIENGKFYLENRSATGVYIALSSHDFPGDTSFITEASISTEGNTGNHSYGVVFGFKDSDNYYAYKISAGNFFSIGKYHQGVYRKLTGGKIGDIAVHKNTANTLKVEKEGNSIRFYINDFFLNEVSGLSFPGNKSGFIVEGKIKIAVHKSLSYVWF